MLNQSVDETSGYESSSQLHREYNPLFGTSPQQNLSRMRLAESVPAIRV
jgi:AraC-like DNA-binding protein